MSTPAESHHAGTSKLPGIEAARGIAAILVVFYHAARHLKLATGAMPFDGIAQLGHAGVDFFFVLSGFIIFFVNRKDIGSPTGLARYAERRFTRIYPLFWFALSVWLALALLSRSGPALTPGGVLLWASLLPSSGEVGVAWTLQHEILFYLIFSVAILHRRIGIAVFGVWFALIGACSVFGYAPEGSALLLKLVSPFNLEFFF